MYNKISVLFWVRSSEKNKKGLAPLKIRITVQDKDKCDFSTGKFVDVSLWNPQRKNVSGKSLEALTINRYISEADARLTDIYTRLNYERLPISAEIIRNIFLDRAQIKSTITTVIEDYIKKAKDKVEKEKSLSSFTLRKYELLLERIKSFLFYKKRKDVFLDEVNYAFISDFETWLLQYGSSTGTNLGKDTATGYLKKLHHIILECFKRGEIKTNPFVNISLKWEKPTAEGISEDQLAKLLEYTSKLKIQRLSIVLDRFIVGCYTGMAHSDISQCTRDNIHKIFGDDGTWIKLYRVKTDELCNIPIFPPVQKIIDKYWDNPTLKAENLLFPKASLQSCNEYIKQIAELAGLPNANDISTHTARHTFAQMAMDLGVNIEAIAKILGHASSRTTKQTYAKASHRFISGEVKKLNGLFSEKKEVVENKSAG